MYLVSIKYIYICTHGVSEDGEPEPSYLTPNIYIHKLYIYNLPS